MDSSLKFWQTQNQWVQLLNIKPEDDTMGGQEAESYAMIQWVMRELKKHGIEFDCYHLTADLGSVEQNFKQWQQKIPDLPWNRFVTMEFPFEMQVFGLRFLGLNWSPVLGFCENPKAQFERFMLTMELPASAVFSGLNESQITTEMKKMLDFSSPVTNSCIDRWEKQLTQRAEQSIDLPPNVQEKIVTFVGVNASGIIDYAMLQLPVLFKTWLLSTPKDAQPTQSQPVVVDAERLNLKSTSELKKAEPLTASPELLKKIKKLPGWALQEHLNEFNMAFSDLLAAPFGEDVVYLYGRRADHECYALHVDLEDERTQKSLLRFTYAQSELKSVDTSFNLFSLDFNLCQRVDQLTALKWGGLHIPSIDNPVLTRQWIEVIKENASSFEVYFDALHLLEPLYRHQIMLKRNVKPAPKPASPPSPFATPRF